MTVGINLLDILMGNSPVEPGSYFHLLATIRRLLIGVAIGFGIGTAIGILMGLGSRTNDFFDSWNWVFATVPAIMWAYMLILALGANEITAISVVAAVIYPATAFQVSQGVKAVRQDIVEMAKVYGADLKHMLWDVYIPQIMPYLFSGARYGLAIGIKIIAIAELVGINSGVGFMINYWWGEFFAGPIIAWGTLLIMLGIAFEYGFFRVLERRAFAWLKK